MNSIRKRYKVSYDDIDRFMEALELNTIQACKYDVDNGYILFVYASPECHIYLGLAFVNQPINH